MRTALIKVFVLLAGLCGSIDPSHAEVKFEPEMAATCKPAAPVGQTLLKWRSACPKGDCFVWRLTCSNGKNYNMQSKIHPATTELENVFYDWAPWSVVLYLLPFLIYAGLAIVGSEAAALLTALNVVFVTYAMCAAWSLYSSITGDPWGRWIEEERLFLLNPYVYSAILIAFIVINLSAVRRGLEVFLYHHTRDSGFAPVMLPAHPMHATAMSVALMPNIYEFVDPAETASYYRRQTEHLRAVRDKLDAQTALAESVIRNRRARNRFQQHD
jgi:hypothetical protein